jgi:hypothetical protein
MHNNTKDIGSLDNDRNVTSKGEIFMPTLVKT